MRSVLALGCGCVAACSLVTSLDGLRGADAGDAAVSPDVIEEVVVVDAGVDARSDGSKINPCTASADASIAADFAVGFSAQQGSCGWSYGYFTAGVPPFGQFTLFDSTNLDWYFSDNEAYLQISRGAMSPQDCDWPVLRWTANVDGVVRFVGMASLPSPGEPISGNGVILNFYVGTQNVYTKTLPNTQQTPYAFDVTTVVSSGGYVYFGVDPNACNSFYDTTLFEVQIIGP